MDFRLSHILAGTSTIESATSALKGFVRWQAPDLLHVPDEPEMDICTDASDFWALGVVFLVSITSLRDKRQSVENLSH